MPRTEHDATMSIFLFHAPATTEIYTLSLHDALPIYPSIISTTGIIEAPAKPRAYYLIMQHSISQGLNLDTLKDKFRGKFLEYHDKNLAQVVRGYAFQAIFYHITSEPFCDSKECILYNAHWQEDLIHAQIELGKLCENHQRILERYKKT